MPKKLQRLEYNSFVKGLITEAGPLTFPENASLEEQNFVLNKDGSRNRRLGMDYEPGYVERALGVTPSLPGLVTQTYVWKNAGGDSRKEILVIQIGRELFFHDNSAESISATVIANVSGITQEYVAASFAVVNSILVVATGNYELATFEYNGNTVIRSSVTLKVRDFFGLEDKDANGTDLRAGQGVSLRPVERTDAHIYNLRNQSFGIPRRGNSSNTVDPIAYFLEIALAHPSNADSVNYAFYPDSQNGENRLIERFFPKDLADNPPGNYAATGGFFIIDILKRGFSRQQALSDLQATYPVLDRTPLVLPEDYTDGGATVVREFAGRIFYAGFKDEVVNGDRHSPRLGNHVLFSQLVKNATDLPKCYQEADPTSNVFSDLVATDGGIIRLEGAFNIQAMEVVANRLIVFAQNGVWAISGGSDYGFDATNYKVEKVADHGIVNPNTIANVDNTLTYWGLSGIYSLTVSDTGGLSVDNLSSPTIQTYYDKISPEEKRSCVGVYDSYKRQVRWLFNTTLSGGKAAEELVLDVGLGAFYIAKFTGASDNLPKPVSVFRTPAFREGVLTEGVTVNTSPVTVQGDPVTTKRFIENPVISELKYLVITKLLPLTYTVAFYRDYTFTDWFSFNGQGVDAKASLVTGWNVGGSGQVDKASPYVHFFFKKTEDGFAEIAGEVYAQNPSSCLVQSQWNWTNSASSGRWSNPFQAYRQKRLYSPTNAESPFDDGEYVVQTKNKVRGYGKALSLKIETEPKKDCQLLGWGYLVAVETDG